MKAIYIKADGKKFYRKFLSVLKSVPPISDLRPKELDVLAELLYQMDKYGDYPYSDMKKIVFSADTRKEMRDNVGISHDSFNNNIYILRKHNIIDDDNNLHKFFRDIRFNDGFELKFIFKNV